MTNINWESSLIDSQNNMKDAIKNLEDSMNRISIVVDEEQRLVGTITDGDIRRAILSGLSMNAEVNKFMNSKPTYIYSNMPKDSVISLMREKDIFQTNKLQKVLMSLMAKCTKIMTKFAEQSDPIN